MNIVPFDEKYMDEMAELFVDAYSEPDCEWDMETARKYLKRNTDEFGEYCFLAVENNECLGGVFCKLDPYCKGYFLLVDSLQVKKKFRKNGVATKLLRKVFEVAKENGVDGVHLLADGRKGFPKSWYKRMGYEPTGWVEYEAKLKDLKV